MRVILALLVIGLFAGDAVASGAIRGTVWPERSEAKRAAKLRAEAERERHGIFGILHLRRGPAPETPVRDAERDQSVVLVRSVPEIVEQKLARNAASAPPQRIVITGDKFVPAVIVVASGEPFTIENRDTLWHDVFSVVPGSRFDSGKLGPGATRTVKLRLAGAVPLHCDFHANEVGFVRVAANHAFARPDSLGRFRLAGLPPGDYDVELWHPWRGSRVTRLTVPRRGDALCDLAL